MIAPADKVFLVIVCSLIFTAFAYNILSLGLETQAEREMEQCIQVCGSGNVQSFTRESAGNSICLCESSRP